MKKRLLIVQVAALGYDFLCRQNSSEELHGLTFRPVESVFPAVTCTVQASFRTALPPSGHGMIANGIFLPELNTVEFWNQSSGLVSGERIWNQFRSDGNAVGLFFWQQSLGENVDMLISPAPVHTHGGGMIDDCYSKPETLYSELCQKTGKRFKLSSYWGPVASVKSSTWIADAVAGIVSDPENAPELCIAYLPHLDYELQKSGTESPKSARAFTQLTTCLERLREGAEKGGYELLVFGDYAIGNVTRSAVFPNRLLLEHGFFNARSIRGMRYPDLYSSRAFAMADHEIAHIYVREQHDVEEVAACLNECDGIEGVYYKPEDLHQRNIAAERSGQIVIQAEQGAWFAYPWWKDPAQAPDYSTHVDIHNKIGFDPCELFFDWMPWKISTDTSKVKGTHGRIGSGRNVGWAATFEMDDEPETLIDLARSVRHWLIRQNV